MQIKNVHAREILDSRGFPTLEVEVRLSSGEWARAAVPSGASTGAHEAIELRDKDAKRFQGKGVLKAIRNIEEQIAPRVQGMSVVEQKKVDDTLCEIDGTPNKAKLGANAILGVSLACARAASQVSGMPFYKYVGGSLANLLPVPMMNVLNGGAHANNGLDIQEYMIVPVCGGSFRESLRAGSEIFHSLKKILSDRGLSTAVGDEGGFAPPLASNEEALGLLTQAIEKAGYRPGDEIFLALDVAATELYAQNAYQWEKKRLDSAELIAVYERWSKAYPLVSIEDGLSEDDWDGWQRLTAVLGEKMQLVGDDLFVTNKERLQRGIEKKAANALLVKVNQIGTLTETGDAVRLAQKSKFNTVMSHRSGETEDVIIADLAVGLGTGQIKTGGLCRSERTAKYNQLLRIEEELGASARYEPVFGKKRW